MYMYFFQESIRNTNLNEGVRLLFNLEDWDLLLELFILLASTENTQMIVIHTVDEVFPKHTDPAVRQDILHTVQIVNYWATRQEQTENASMHALLFAARVDKFLNWLYDNSKIAWCSSILIIEYIIV